ncbi:hypothetical protein TNCV_4959551 [Trichonephila clavipes]|uniref:Uncharacterized protein n=1 Tax=Trichonephila clavipes TaxID=2585209 RepID=A0A8X6SL79_TRICX|nr:hypothetical protein TNCV_4959551 [Trichonephila clavipes]
MIDEQRILHTLPALILGVLRHAEATRTKIPQELLLMSSFYSVLLMWRRSFESGVAIRCLPRHLTESRDGEPLARVPLMTRGTILWALHRSKRSTAIDSSIKEFSVRFSQIKELAETLKFIMYPDVTWFDKLNLPQLDWLEIEEFD